MNKIYCVILWYFKISKDCTISVFKIMINLVFNFAELIFNNKLTF